MPMELQKVYLLGLQPLTTLRHVGSDSLARNCQWMEDAVFGGSEKCLFVRVC